MNIFIIMGSDSAHEIGEIDGVFEFLEDAMEMAENQTLKRYSYVNIEEWPVGSNIYENLWLIDRWRKEWSVMDLDSFQMKKWQKP